MKEGSWEYSSWKCEGARARLEEKENGRKLAVMIGGSQMGRIAGEMQRIGGELVGVHKMYKVTGEWTEEEGGEGKE